MFACVLHHEHLGYDYVQIQYLFSKEYHVVYTKFLDFHNLDQNAKPHREILEQFEKINALIKGRIK